MKYATLFPIAIASLVLAGCGGDDHDHPHTPAGSGGGHAHGPHGGHLLELGDAGHLEWVHDAAAGSVRLHLTGPDAKSPLVVARPPEIKLQTKEGLKVVAAVPVGGSSEGASEYTAVDPALRTEHPEGRITIEIGGKVFNPDLELTHDH